MLGLRHALDSDHVAAVSTVLAQRPSLRASGLVGFSWGIGHTLVLLLVGVVVLRFRVPVPAVMAQVAEGVVGGMLVVLGGLLGVKLFQERWHIHQHEHDGDSHMLEDHGHPHVWRESLRPLCIGMAHGLAGSAALLLLVVSTAGSVAEGLLYIAVFGCGSILGMMLIGLALSVPVVCSLRLGRSALFAVQVLASLGSLGLGFSIVYGMLVDGPVS
jgi:sulfite exporter TauE/SafE